MKEILVSKLEDRHPFFDLVQNTFVFLTCFFCNFLKALRDMQNFPQKCQRIAMCSECSFNGSRPLIASKPCSSPQERPGLDNINHVMTQLILVPLLQLLTSTSIMKESGIEREWARGRREKGKERKEEKGTSFAKNHDGFVKRPKLAVFLCWVILNCDLTVRKKTRKEMKGKKQRKREREKVEEKGGKGGGKGKRGTQEKGTLRFRENPWQSRQTAQSWQFSYVGLSIVTWRWGKRKRGEKTKI